MKAKRRAATLRRMHRLRVIEGMAVKRDLADARALQMRMHGLQQRTQNMAQDYSHRPDGASGAELRQGMGLAQLLITLGKVAAREEQQAAMAADAAATKLAALDSNQERLDEAIQQLEREMRALAGKDHSDAPRLARHLLKGRRS